MRGTQTCTRYRPELDSEGFPDWGNVDAVESKGWIVDARPNTLTVTDTMLLASQKPSAFRTGADFPDIERFDRVRFDAEPEVWTVTNVARLHGPRPNVVLTLEPLNEDWEVGS